MQSKENLTEANDSVLISAYVRGNERAFEILVNRHKDRLYTGILMIVRDRYVAEDLLQDAFIKAVNMIRRGKYNEEGKFFPWVSRIAHNMAIDHFRKHKRYPTIVVEDGNNVFDTMAFAAEDCESIKVRQEEYDQVKALIRELPDAQRQVLIMRHHFKMSFQEIADHTGVSINTALGRMRYALINLRKMMEQNNDAYETPQKKQRSAQKRSRI